MARLTPNQRIQLMAPRALRLMCTEPEKAFGAHVARAMYGRLGQTVAVTENDAGVALQLLEKHGLATSQRKKNPCGVGQVRMYAPTAHGFIIAWLGWFLTDAT